jgi:4-amino-4-deoxy-L-arabinose transferase-like glycosyltransferase
VVNNHLQPWWFFLPVLVVASLPFTPLLLAGLAGATHSRSVRQLPEHSLQRFATCWLLAVLLFFTLAATKLPSYWIPATPAAGLLIALAAQQRPGRWVMASTLLLQGVLAVGLAASSRWVPLIDEPELPTLPAELLASGLLSRAAACFGLALLAGVVLWCVKAPWARGWLLAQQLAVVAFAVSALQPMVTFGDRLRQVPLRRLAVAVQHQRRSGEPLAMVGILKPSLHFYANQVVIYEGVQANGPLNLNDRLSHERRRGQIPSPPAPGSSVLLVIDQRTAQLPHWRGLSHQTLASEGLFDLWRVPRQALDQWAAQLKRSDIPPEDWQQPRPERY